MSIVMKYKLLVTGSEGFLGKELVRQARAEGAEVIRTTSKKERSDPSTGLFYLDITSKKQFESLIESTMPDYIAHLAGLSFPNDSETNPLAKKINYDSVINLLRSVKSIINRHSEYRPTLVFYSSVEVYGDGSGVPIIDEYTPHNPTLRYGEIKSMAEKAFLKFILKHKMAGIVVQHGQTIGIGQDERFLIPTVVKQIVQIVKGKSKPVIKTGPVSQERTLMDTRDAASAVLKLMKTGRVGERYIVCGDENIPLKVVIEKLIKLSGQSIIHEIVDIGMIPGGNRKYSNIKIKKDIDWSPKIPLSKTLQDILNYELNKEKSSAGLQDKDLG